MRYEFSTSTKKAAYAASGGVCMASGPVYGLDHETRCTLILVAGNHEFDHYPLPAHVEGSDGVENCMVVCKLHHSYKTRKFDIPVEAKIKRVHRKHGIDPDRRKLRPKMRSAGFRKGGPKQKIPSRKFEKRRS